MSVSEKLVMVADRIQRVYDSGKQVGKQNEYDRFWDAFQNNGNRNIYMCAFATPYWTDAIYEPKYPIRIADNDLGAFYATGISNTKVPIICTTAVLESTFADAASLTTIPSLVVDEGTTYDHTFENCAELRSINVSGAIGSTISFDTSPNLDLESCISIIRSLKDYIEDNVNLYKFTVRFSGTIVQMLSDTVCSSADWFGDEKYVGVDLLSIITEKGWLY